jgi:hypothetical protein
MEENGGRMREEGGGRSEKGRRRKLTIGIKRKEVTDCGQCLLVDD